MTSRSAPHFRRRLLAWYATARRPLPWRDTRDPYAVWVSEVMLQQTQVKTVLPYYDRFLVRFPDIATLADADLESVLKIWEGLGYYARARNLHRAARIIIREREGIFPSTYEEIKALPGIGESIAASIASFLFGLPHAVVDGNVKRVVSRLFCIDAPINTTAFTKNIREGAGLLVDRHNPGTFNQAMMELGALVCTFRNPDCERCPAHRFCQAYFNGAQTKFPTRKKPNVTPEYHIAIAVIYKGKRLLITRRKPEGLLGGLWEFPGGKIKEGEPAEDACRREIKEEVNLDIDIIEQLTSIKHAYSHFRIKADVFVCRYKHGRVSLKGPVAFRWITPDNLGQFPFPAANHKFIPLIE